MWNSNVCALHCDCYVFTWWLSFQELIVSPRPFIDTRVHLIAFRPMVVCFATPIYWYTCSFDSVSSNGSLLCHAHLVIHVFTWWCFIKEKFVTSRPFWDTRSLDGVSSNGNSFCHAKFSTRVHLMAFYSIRVCFDSPISWYICSLDGVTSNGSLFCHPHSARPIRAICSGGGDSIYNTVGFTLLVSNHLK